MKYIVPQDKIDRGIYWSHGCTAIEGCTPVSEGCEHCWAAAMAHQYKRDFSKVSVHLDRLERVVRGKPGKVISLWNDWCHEQISTEQHNELLRIIDDNPQHVFLGLTKRPSFILPPTEPFLPDLPVSFPSNFWVGTTAENQELAYIRIPELLKCDNPNLFLSLEPLLGPITFPKVQVPFFKWATAPGISWCIVGCETGPNRRPCDPEWIRQIVQECQEADVPCFVKAVNINGRVLKYWNDPDFPDDLKVRKFPCAFEVDEDADGR